MNLTFPEGKEGRYVYFAERVTIAFILNPNSLARICKTRHMTDLCFNSGGMRECNPGTFFPGTVGIPRAEIVRDCSTLAIFLSRVYSRCPLCPCLIDSEPCASLFLPFFRKGAVVRRPSHDWVVQQVVPRADTETPTGE